MKHRTLRLYKVPVTIHRNDYTVVIGNSQKSATDVANKEKRWIAQEMVEA